ncbi:hypothetical protein BANRA_04984 [Klebsiella pneumoniae]|nr:hypothetical protein BANRA_04984 [Klebsiella pneumoniae]
MEEKKAYGLVMVFVGVFVLILVSICRTACGGTGRLTHL